jgi:hypothetical protein
VNVIQASGLRSADLNASSDPYLIVDIPSKPHLSFKTKVVKTCLNPFWREVHEIDGVELGDTLLIKCMDWDAEGEHDAIGEAKLQVLPGGFVGELQLVLRGRKAGTVRIEVTIPQQAEAKNTKKPPSHLKAMEAGDPRVLVAALQESGEEAVRAVGILENMTTNEESRSLFVAAGAVQPLVALLCEGSSESKSKVATALSNLSLCTVGRRVILSAGGLPMLLELLGDTLLAAREEAAGALLRLAVLDKVREEIFERGAIAQLVSLLSSGSEKGSCRAARLLAYVAEKPGAASVIVQEGALPALAQLLGSGGPTIGLQAAFALGSLANSNAHRKAVISANALPSVIGLLTSGSSECRAQAAATVAALADDDADPLEPHVKPATFIAAGAVKPLVALLADPYNPCVENASRALCSMATSPEIGAELLSAGVLPHLLALLKANVRERQHWATELTHAIAKFEVNHKALEARMPQDRNKDILVEVVKIAKHKSDAKFGLTHQSSLPSLREGGHRPQPQRRLGTESFAKTLPNLDRSHSAVSLAGSPCGQGSRVDIGVDLRFVYPRIDAFRPKGLA